MAHQAIRIGGYQCFFRVRRHRKGKPRQGIAAADADTAQREQAEDARHVGTGPAARILAVGRRVIAEIGREQHRADEEVLDRRACHAKRKATTGGMAEQGDRRTRVRLPYRRGEVGEIVLEPADIADIAAVPDPP